jgi:hypothetical protein
MHIHTHSVTSPLRFHIKQTHHISSLIGGAILPDHPHLVLDIIISLSILHQPHSTPTSCAHHVFFLFSSSSFSFCHHVGGLPPLLPFRCRSRLVPSIPCSIVNLSVSSCYKCVVPPHANCAAQKKSFMPWNTTCIFTKAVRVCVCVCRTCACMHVFCVCMCVFVCVFMQTILHVCRANTKA